MYKEGRRDRAGFNVIYADPPYQYRNKKTGGTMKSGAEAKYPTMALKDIKALPVPDVMDKNSVLFLWTTTPMLLDALSVLEVWNYKYKSMLTWRKIMSLGMGFWLRIQTEHILLGVRGKVKAFRLQECNFHQSKAGKHSHKPEYFRGLIERATANMPNRRMLELFATEEAMGWTALGLEIDGRDIRESLPELIGGIENDKG